MKTKLLVCAIIFFAFTYFVPNTLLETKTAKAAGGKVIDISIPDQQMTIIENYQIVNKFPVSTGKWDMPTPIGTHQIYNHIPEAYSTPYDLYMQNWMAITPDGGYGIHGLPYWKYSWGNVYEGENHLGIRVSHGCVRLSIANSAWLYNWAPNGTTVIIHDTSGIQAAFNPPDYAGEIIEQSSSYITLKPGETAQLSVKLKNVGKNWWYNVGSRPVHLATSSPIDRISAFANNTWINSNRVTGLPRSGVANNEEVTLSFTITAPAQNGDYEEHFRPVAENYSWFEDTDIIWHIKVWQPEYSCQWISQSEYPTIAKSKTTSMQIKFKNTGSKTWINNGPNAIRLATSHSKDRNSVFYDTNSWLATNRVGSMDEAQVAPGEIGTFTFVLKAPNQTGSYTEYFQLVAEGISWMEDYGTFWNINVK